MGQDDDDATLVRRCLAGDARGERVLVERYRDAVWRLAKGATGDPDAALDIVQETFVAAFGALSRYDPGRPFRAWIARIALNKSRDWTRRRMVRRMFEFSSADGADEMIADDAASPEQVAGARAELAAVTVAIARLPSQLKEVLLLRSVEGLSQVETALSLGITEKAVETRLHRARVKIAEMMRDGLSARV